MKFSSFNFHKIIIIRKKFLLQNIYVVVYGHYMAKGFDACFLLLSKFVCIAVDSLYDCRLEYHFNDFEKLIHQIYVINV